MTSEAASPRVAPSGRWPLASVLEAAVVICAVATIPLTLLLEEKHVPQWAPAADWIIWSVFVAEYLVLLSLSDSRCRFITRHPLHLLVLVLSFPHLPAILGLVRLLRLVRAWRLVRLVGVSARAISALGAVLGRRGLRYVAGTSLVILFAGGAALAMLEPQTVRGGLFDGVWWAVVTATTVGYGDIAPVTPWGRLIAVLLMLTGVGLVSTLAASIAAHFVAQDEGAELNELLERTARLEKLIEQLTAALLARGTHARE